MNRWIRRQPIRRKVALLMGAASVVALLLAGVAVVLYEFTTFRPRVLRDAKTQAELIRGNSVTALQLNDREAMRANLDTLRSRPEILSATLFDADGTVQARYAPRGAPPPPSVLTPGATFYPGRLLLIDRIAVDSQPIGWLSLQYAVPPLWLRLQQYGIMVAVVLFALGIASALLLGMLGRSVTVPLLRLAGAAREITETGNYRLQVPPRAGDEIGVLTDAFNRMVATAAEQQVELRQNEARLRLALDSARLDAWVLDLPADGPPLLEPLLARVSPPDRAGVAAQIGAAIAERSGFKLEFRAPGNPGDERWTALMGRIYRDEATGTSRLIGVAQDVTEQRRTEQQLIQSQRMEAIGNLAGGIAHDFNNLLTAIIGYLSFVQRRLPPDAQVREDLTEVERAARRAAALTSQLLSYARRQMVVPASVDLNATVAGLTPMMRRLVGEDIEVETELAETDGSVRVDPGQLEQVMLNLVANARDAMPAGGALRLRTRHVTLTPAAARTIPEARPGQYIALEVEDTGVGMTPEVQARIFEPFFTTKPPGAGTGLGLAMCYGIVRQADGLMLVESEPGGGARFSVLLPREGSGVEEGIPPAAPIVVPGRETVLLVEDDPTVRVVTGRILRELGYTVLEAASGAEARSVAATAAGRIDLLLTDVVMPGGSGRELAEALTQTRPGLPVVFMSGYTADVILRMGIVHDKVTLLSKPFTAEALADTLRIALDRTGQHG
jgi:signal transduction histidine kinase/ActR/RegA family two-component response regulator/HAMP domain-containing protein